MQTAWNWNLPGRLPGQLSIADYLDRNRDLQEFLSTDYADAAEYYEAYVHLMENQVIQYYYTAQSAYSIVICTENQTITNGSYFVRRQSVENSSWYRAFLESRKNIYLYSYYEDGVQSGGYIEKGRRIVLIQRMNYCGDENIIMLELDYRSMSETMAQICNGADAYFCMNDRVVMSDGDGYNKEKAFQERLDDSDKGCSLQRSLELYGRS